MAPGLALSLVWPPDQTRWAAMFDSIDTHAAKTYLSPVLVRAEV
jgi:hypothetical protein